eukprot:scaffold1535_cov382-Prasinococcus_capsulatus_cf.AAC.16
MLAPEPPDAPGLPPWGGGFAWPETVDGDGTTPPRACDLAAARENRPLTRLLLRARHAANLPEAGGGGWEDEGVGEAAGDVFACEVDTEDAAAGGGDGVTATPLPAARAPFGSGSNKQHSAS